METVNCPFYAHTIRKVPVDSGREPVWLRIPNPGSNQCALVTDAHSPCIMEVIAKRTPDWEQCSRRPNGLVVGPAVESTEIGPTPEQVVMRQMGRKGGKIGGKRRLETMTDAERSKSARKASKARWSKGQASK